MDLLPLRERGLLESLPHRPDAGPRRASDWCIDRQTVHRPGPTHPAFRPRLSNDRLAGTALAGQPRGHKPHNRPHVGNDPNSESQFRTIKYRPDLPGRFGSFEGARDHCNGFFTWYNDDHRVSSTGLHTRTDAHYGRADDIREQRGDVVITAIAEHPEQFVRQIPTPPTLPTVMWLNEPEE
jgi:hypothetical protein